MSVTPWIVSQSHILMLFDFVDVILHSIYECKYHSYQSEKLMFILVKEGKWRDTY